MADNIPVILHVGPDAGMVSELSDGSKIISFKCPGKFTHIITIETEEPVHYLFIGGYFYKKGNEDFDLSFMREISLMPYYCYFRIFPMHHDHYIVNPAAYINMPLFCLQGNGWSFGLEFSPVLEKNIPLAFALQRKNGKLEFILGFFKGFEVFSKGEEHFREWDESPLKYSGKIEPDFEGLKKLKINIFKGISWKDIVREFIECHVQNQKKVDVNFHLTKALNYIYLVSDPKLGHVLEWKKRGAHGFKNGYFSLPAYNTLIEDLLPFANEKKLNRIRTKLVETSLSEDASSLFEDGRIWHNSLHKAYTEKKPVYYTHLGTGIGGYPGGQATMLRSLLGEVHKGRLSKMLITRVSQGLEWLLKNQSADGHWHRVFYVFDEKSSLRLISGEGSFSAGAVAEGSWVMFGAYKAFKDEKYLRSGLAALEWVNNFAEGGVVTSGYFRDSSQDETEGVSAVFAVHANVMAFNVTGHKGFLEKAVDFGFYLATWIRFWDKENASFDPMAFSFKPRIAPCESAWAAEAFLVLFRTTGERFWLLLAEHIFHPFDLENEFSGYSEGLYYDSELKLHPMSFDCAYTASAVIRFLNLYRKLTEMEFGNFKPQAKPFMAPAGFMERFLGKMRKISE